MESGIELIYIASAKLADALFKAGVPLIDQGVMLQGTYCFVFQVLPENKRAVRRILKSAYKG